MTPECIHNIKRRPTCTAGHHRHHWIIKERPVKFQISLALDDDKLFIKCSCWTIMEILSSSFTIYSTQENITCFVLNRLAKENTFSEQQTIMDVKWEYQIRRTQSCNWK